MARIRSFPGERPKITSRSRELYANYLGKPLGHKSEQLLHTKWFDKSAKMKELQAKGEFPNPRFEKEFAAGTYLMNSLSPKKGFVFVLSANRPIWAFLHAYPAITV